jgi:histidyl-tRNA synthetase
MRDFLPREMLKREYIFGVIKEVFAAYGFEPISTPVMELRSTLMGNYGEDAEKLIFQAQHSGGGDELALRYDLTVPLSRFFAQHENDLSLPFRRYHIAPVWRGERPGRGRYREFYQCDADIVGLKSMAADAECVSLVYAVLTRLGFKAFSIKMNNRKLLTGIGVYAGVPESQLGGLYRSIDKTDKIGLAGVAEELRKNGLPDEVVSKMIALLELPTQDKTAYLGQLRQTLAGIPTAEEGISELKDLLRYLKALGVPDERTSLDLTMVRGLGYYTGPIFETVITEPEDLGSVQGGGRYDNLIGMFRSQSLPTTGISLGIERIIDLMDQLNLYPPQVRGTVVEVLVTTFNESLLPDSMQLASELRGLGIAAETYLDGRKALGKQLGYADGKGIPLAAIIGGDEVAQGVVKLKRLADSHEVTVGRADLGATVRDLLG